MNWIPIVMVALNLAWSGILAIQRREIVRNRVDLAKDKKLFAMQRAGKI